MDESERWLIDGDCEKCRRKNYCKRQCTKNSRRISAIIHQKTVEILQKRTGIVPSHEEY